MNGVEDLSNLFSRVTALEQEQSDNDQSVTQIMKVYPSLGIRVKVTWKIHQYRICGDTQPLYAAVCGADTYL